MALTIRRAEAGAVDDKDMCFLEQVEDKLLVGLPRPLVESDFGEDVEGPVGLGCGDALNLVESLVGEIAARSELVVDYFNVILGSA